LHGVLHLLEMMQIHAFAVLPVAAKYRMSSVPDFLVSETLLTVLQFAVVSPLVALAYCSVRTAAAPRLPA
jgi:hypothetical protein